MKSFKIIICIIVALLGGSLIDASANNAEATQAQTTQQSQWIEIGEVKMSQGGTTQKAILYVLNLGDKFIYRIQWRSNFYTVNKYENSRTYNAIVEIPLGKYYFNVPQW